LSISHFYLILDAIALTRKVQKEMLYGN
jgi:hypothetical protein